MLTDHCGHGNGLIGNNYRINCVCFPFRQAFGPTINIQKRNKVCFLCIFSCIYYDRELCMYAKKNLSEVVRFYEWLR